MHSLTAIFQDNTGKPVPEYHHYGFHYSTDDGLVVTAGALRCAKLQSNFHHQQTNTQLFAGRMPFVSPNQQCQSTEGRNLILQLKEI